MTAALIYALPAVSWACMACPVRGAIRPDRDRRAVQLEADNHVCNPSEVF